MSENTSTRGANLHPTLILPEIVVGGPKDLTPDVAAPDNKVLGITEAPGLLSAPAISNAFDHEYFIPSRPAVGVQLQTPAPAAQHFSQVPSGLVVPCIMVHDTAPGPVFEKPFCVTDDGPGLQAPSSGWALGLLKKLPSEVKRLGYEKEISLSSSCKRHSKDKETDERKKTMETEHGVGKVVLSSDKHGEGSKSDGNGVVVEDEGGDVAGRAGGDDVLGEAAYGSI